MTETFVQAAFRMEGQAISELNALVDLLSKAKVGATQSLLSPAKPLVGAVLPVSDLALLQSSTIIISRDPAATTATDPTLLLRTVNPADLSAPTAQPSQRLDMPVSLDGDAAAPSPPSQTSTTTPTSTAAAAQRPPAMAAPVDQVAIQLVRAVGDRADRINIQLEPAELGRIDVKLEVGHDGRVLAVIAADRQDTLDLLQRDARTLERALQEAGLKADSQSLSFDLRGNGGQQQQQADSDPTGSLADSVDAVQALPTNLDLAAFLDPGRASRGIDIRI